MCGLPAKGLRSIGEVHPGLGEGRFAGAMGEAAEAETVHLTERQERILRAVCRDFVVYGQEVGSSALVRRLSIIANLPPSRFTCPKARLMLPSSGLTIVISS